MASAGYMPTAVTTSKKLANVGKNFASKSSSSLDNNESEIIIAYACKFCRQSYPNKTKLLQHINGKHKEPKFTCSGCGKKFQWSSGHHYHKQKCPQYLQQQGSLDQQTYVPSNMEQYPH